MRRKLRLVEIGLVLLALVLMACVLLLPARGAPAPSFRATFGPAGIGPALLLGSWDCDWAGTPCVVRLKPGGRYECVWRGRLYRGRWGVVRREVLCIEEETGEVDDFGRPRTTLYAVRLDGRTRSGPLVAGWGSPGTVTLKRRLPPGS